MVILFSEFLFNYSGIEFFYKNKKKALWTIILTPYYAQAS